MKKETYTFIIGLGIGFGVKKFIDKPITAAKANIIQSVKKKATDEFYKLLWGESPEEHYNRWRHSKPYTDYYTGHNHRSYRKGNNGWTTPEGEKVKNSDFNSILDNLAERLYSNGKITIEDVEDIVKEVNGE